MKGTSGQYVNELVSLTILALMVIALVAGEVGISAAAAAAAPDEAHSALTANVHILIDAVSLHSN